VSAAALEDRLKARARDLGFDSVGVAPAAPADGFERYREWLDCGYAGEMDYLHRHEAAREHPSSVLADVRSVVMVGMDYSWGAEELRNGQEPNPPNPLPEAGRGDRHNAISSNSRPPAPPFPLRQGGPGGLGSARVARYAIGPDYHGVMWEKLDRLLAWLRDVVPGCKGRGVVDTAPLLERDFARRAGLGWIGKNTLLINKHRGSYLFIGALLVDIELRPDEPHTASHCGTCTACLDACPTQAFTGPGWLDARRCISYLTIELRSPIPDELKPGVGDHLFGCDVCQEVCPWNTGTAGNVLALDPVELLGLSEEEFRRRFRGTVFFRAKRRGLLRNAAVVLGNAGDPSALPALRRAAADPEPLVREAARWAIGRIEGRAGVAATHFPLADVPGNS
jgi:epoxyqueuosine reductase